MSARSGCRSGGKALAQERGRVSRWGRRQSAGGEGGESQGRPMYACFMLIKTKQLKRYLFKHQSSLQSPCLPSVWRILEGAPLKTTLDITILIFSAGGCPSYPFYLLRGALFFMSSDRKPASKGATKDHSSSKLLKGNLQTLKLKWALPWGPVG